MRHDVQFNGRESAWAEPSGKSVVGERDASASRCLEVRLVEPRPTNGAPPRPPLDPALGACYPSGVKYEPLLHIVLYQPEIPYNTGSVGRTCVAAGAKLCMVRPFGFRVYD